jgi:hypothetical protein
MCTPFWRDRSATRSCTRTPKYESLEGAGEPAVEATTLIFGFDVEHLVVVVACSIGSQR